MTLRLLVGPAELDGVDLEAVYAAPESWLRANMVSTVDGAATGDDGRAGSINNDVDQQVFHLLRSHAEAILVGAGTARTEQYRPAAKPLVIVSHSGLMPEQLIEADSLLVTRSKAPGLEESSSRLGDERVIVLGDDAVDLSLLRPVLTERGLRHILCEGGPSLLADLVAASAVDELCATIVPTMVGGDHPRISHGAPFNTSMELTHLLEADGTLLGRWRIGSAPHQGDGS